jgi:hypothetical protein
VSWPPRTRGGSTKWPQAMVTHAAAAGHSGQPKAGFFRQDAVDVLHVSHGSHVLVWGLETVPDRKGYATALGHDSKSDDEVREMVAQHEKCGQWPRA